MADQTLDTLFHETLKDIYYAERKIATALRKMARAAQNPDLKAAFETHEQETQAQYERLTEVFEAIGKKPRGKTCDAIEGIIAEGQEIMDEFKGSPALDAGLLAAAQAVEHYEIARYGTLKSWAAQLGLSDAERLLDQTLQEEGAQDAAVGAAMGGMNLKNLLSAGMSAMPVDSDGVPFDMSHIYASGNIAAESTGRTLAVRLWQMTDDPGMKDMLSYLIARDTMHQNQFVAALEDLGGTEAVFPIPNSFSQADEAQSFSYAYLGFQADGSAPAPGRWSEGTSPDGKGRFASQPMQALGEKPDLGKARPGSGAQSEQI